MDFVRTLQSLEEAVYEVITWVLFLPKTLAQILFRPDWVRGYVSAEFDKDQADRFQAYLSPVLFWLIVAVVPYAATSLNTDTTQLNLRIPDMSILLSTMLLLVTVPTWFAFILLKMQSQPLERSALKRLLYIQCYPAALFELMILPSAVYVASRGEGLSPAVVAISQVLLVIGVAWFLLAQVTIFRAELRVGWGGALGRAAIATLSSLLILAAVLTGYVLFLWLTGSMQMPG